MPLIIAIFAVSIFALIGYKLFIDKEESHIPEQTTTENTEELEEEDKPTIITLDETPEKEGGYYIKKVPMIGGQQTYITIPKQYEEENPPRIIVYSHGQDQEITVYETEEFMQQMVAYGEFFSKHNYIFAASNMHEDNWGSDEAVEDMQAMVEWIKARYKTKPKIYLLGFSMGGLPTFNYAFEHPENVTKIASLAGTTRSQSWSDDDLLILKGIRVKIWHGDADSNVLYRYSEQLVSRCLGLGVDVQLRTVQGATHWDVDWEYHAEVLSFFEN